MQQAINKCLRRVSSLFNVVTLPGLRKWRLLAALTQGQLADKAKVSRLSVTRLEGGGEATPTTVRKLADALGVTPADLYTDQ